MRCPVRQLTLAAGLACAVLLFAGPAQPAASSPAFAAQAAEADGPSPPDPNPVVTRGPTLPPLPRDRWGDGTFVPVGPDCVEGPPRNLSRPQVFGEPYPDVDLTKNNGSWEVCPPPTGMGQQWLRNGGGFNPPLTGDTYHTTGADVGSFVQIQIQVCNDFGCTTVESDPFWIVDRPAATPQCRNGLDDDGDGLVDYGADPGCDSPDDPDEYNAPAGTCAGQDGVYLYKGAGFTGDCTVITSDQPDLAAWNDVVRSIRVVGADFIALGWSGDRYNGVIRDFGLETADLGGFSLSSLVVDPDTFLQAARAGKLTRGAPGASPTANAGRPSPEGVAGCWTMSNTDQGVVEMDYNDNLFGIPKLSLGHPRVWFWISWCSSNGDITDLQTDSECFPNRSWDCTNDKVSVIGGGVGRGFGYVELKASATFTSCATIYIPPVGSQTLCDVKKPIYVVRLLTRGRFENKTFTVK